MMPGRDVVIVGAGLSGCLLAAYLAQRGHRVRVFERRGDPRVAGYVGGRSINLALSVRGLWGLAGAGLDELVMRQDAIPMPGRMLHDREGRTSFQPYSKNPTDAINSVSRGGLNLTLLHAAAALPGVQFYFDAMCVDVDLDAPAAIFALPGGRQEKVEADVVLGADGAFSPVRGRLQKTDRFDYSQTYLAHGYKELHIPPRDGKGDARFAMNPHALHIWPRRESMMIALPNRDGSFTCTLFWPFEGPGSFASLRSGDDVRSFFQREYSDAVPLMPTLTHDYQNNPVGSLATVRCWPWQWQGKVGVLGDAAHAVVPFYGQGMNCSFEDVRVLAELLDANGQDFAAALPAMQAARKPNADAIADMAIANFLEMRDLAGRSEFQYRKRVERALHEALGDAFSPQYNLVSFSTVPYAQARERGRAMDAIIDRVVHAVPTDAGLAPGDWLARLSAAATAAHAFGSAAQSSAATLIDITPAVSPSINVWPGDTPFSREVLCHLDKGDTVTLSTIRTTVHLGAHADGPNHYGRGCEGVGERRLEHYVGLCRVIEARAARGARVTPADIVGGVGQVREPRVLIRTGTFPSFDAWSSDFAALSVELVEALAARGVTTIGIDTPSVDLQESKDLPAHKAILKHDISILEGLALAGVDPGVYELIALPLKLIGADASPVRAVLRRV